MKKIQIIIILGMSLVVIANEKIPHYSQWAFGHKKYYPVEQVPPLTDAKKKEVAARPVPQAKVVISKSGAPILCVNGKEYLYSTWITMARVPLPALRVKSIKQVGVNFITGRYNFSKHEPERGWGSHYGLNSKNFFKGEGLYDPKTITPWLWRFVKTIPQAYIVMDINPDDYPGFPEKYPDELMKSYNGSRYMGINHFAFLECDKEKIKSGKMQVRRSQNVDDPRLRPLWSMFSDVLLSQMTDAASAFVKEVEKTLPGSKAVIGYSIGGGADNQMYNWHPTTYKRTGKPHMWGDYSKPAKKAWAKFLQKKYRNIDILNKKWSKSFKAFDQVSMPSGDHLAGGKELFFNPIRDMDCIAYSRFMSTARVNIILSLAKAMKKSSKHQIVMQAYGTPHNAARSTCTDNEALLTSPYIDILGSQITYGKATRYTGGPGGVNGCLMSHLVNGKVFSVDQDYPTYLSIGTHPNHGFKKNRSSEEFISLMFREASRLWCRGAAFSWHSLKWPWVYEDDKIKKGMKFINGIQQDFCDPYLENTRNEIAVIYDERANDYIAGRHNFQFLWTVTQMTELNSSGVPYRQYYAGDFRRGLVKPAKVYIFQNQLKLDDKFMSQLGKIKKNGAVIIFLQGVGYAQQNLELIEKAVGIKLQKLKGYKTGGKTKPPAKHILTKGLVFNTKNKLRFPPYSLKQGSMWPKILTFSNGRILHPFGEAALMVDDSGAETLACYAQSKIPGMAMKKHKNYTSIFIGGYAISRKMINRIAKFSGAWTVTKPDCAMAINNKLLMIHPFNDGEFSIDMAKKVMLSLLDDNYEFKDINKNSQRKFNFNLKKGKTYFYKVKTR